jgi:hypothetical protein
MLQPCVHVGIGLGLEEPPIRVAEYFMLVVE